MKCKIISAITAIAAFIFLHLNAAAETAVLTQAFIEEQDLDLFISGSFDAENAEVEVANHTADVIDSGNIHEKELSVRTTFLVDVSTSIPIAAREKITEFIGLNIKNLPENEQLKIVTFGDEISILQDFTDDRYDLDKTLESIIFDGQQSMVYDAIYNTIPDVGTLNGKPCFYRTIILTDGVDYATGGITKEELFISLRDRSYPLDVISVSEQTPSVQNKELSALTRISGGRYFELYPESDASSLVSETSVGDYFWIRAEVPVTLLDGSTRQIDISDGTNAISFDMKMSIVDAPEPPVESSTFTSSIAPPVSSSVSVPYSTVTEDEEEDGFDLNFVLIIAGAAVVMIAAAVVVVIFWKKKREKTPTVQQSRPIQLSEYPTTEFIDGSNVKEHYTIKISNVANSSDERVLDVFSDIIIGRAESCTVVFNDLSVSREQCKIAATKNGLVISNLSSTNKTKLNGEELKTEFLLRPADNIHFGRITLCVDYIQMVKDEDPAQNTPLSGSDDSKTLSMFR